MDHSPHGRIEDPAWSRDGRWLAYACPRTRADHRDQAVPPSRRQTGAGHASRCCRTRCRPSTPSGKLPVLHRPARSSTRSTTSCSSTWASRSARGRTRSRCARTCRRRSCPGRGRSSEEATGQATDEERRRRPPPSIDLDGHRAPGGRRSRCRRAATSGSPGSRARRCSRRTRSRARSTTWLRHDPAAKGSSTSRLRQGRSRRRSSTASPTSGSGRDDSDAAVPRGRAGCG